jgi:hypothetical protein
MCIVCFDSPPHLRQKAPKVSDMVGKISELESFYAVYLFNSFCDTTSEAGQNAVVSALSAEAPSDVRLFSSSSLSLPLSSLH